MALFDYFSVCPLGLETAQSLAGICQVLSGNIRIAELLYSITCNTISIGKARLLHG